MVPNFTNSSERFTLPAKRSTPRLFLSKNMQFDLNNNGMVSFEHAFENLSLFGILNRNCKSSINVDVCQWISDSSADQK